VTLSAFIHAWADHPSAFIACLGLLGLIFGSFVNVVIWRWPAMMERAWWQDTSSQLADAESFSRTFGASPPESLAQAHHALEDRLRILKPFDLARPGSHCPACEQPLRWWHNVPLVSWVMLRGRCAACDAPISWQYPVVELGCAALFATLGWRLGPAATTVLWCAWAATLVAAAVIDWRTTLLPDALTLPLMWGGLIAAVLGWTLPPATALLGASVGYLVLWGVHRAFLMVTGREGMGRGDFKLLAALGAWLGWQPLLPLLLWASVAGSLVGWLLQRTGRLQGAAYVPFGPFLAGSALAVLLIGPEQALESVLWLGAWVNSALSG